MAVFEHIACTVCGCVCDDLRVTVEDGAVVRAEGACSLAEPWLLSQGSRQPPTAEIDGRAVSPEEGLARATQILTAASSPLIYGIARSSTLGQRAAVRLAEQLGATIDTNASRCHAPSIMALQEVGEVTCTLGEVRNRADLVIYWGSNPLSSHPRHQERYAVEPQGRHTPQGRAGRTVVVADVKPTASSAAADIFLPIEPGRDFEVLLTLRRLVQGAPLPADSTPGAPLDVLRDLAQRMKSCRYGIVFFGLGLSLSKHGQHNVEALLLLVRELNAYTRFAARRMRVQGDVSGADTVLLWQTGYPFSVNFAVGYPRYNPGEFSAQEMLERGDVDACLFIGTEGVAFFSEQAVNHLRRIPVIALEHPTVDSLIAPTVRFTTAVYGIHRPGTAYRMDGVPIPLQAFLPSQYPSDEEVLAGIERRVIGD